jgi:hypothetical protein
VTRDQETRYLFALARKVKKFFPGYRVGGVNPGIELVRWEKHLSGKSTAVDTVRMSGMAARCLLEQKGPKRVLRRDL